MPKLDCVNCNKREGCKRIYTTMKCNYFELRRGHKLAELALAHPQGLHDALSALPFVTFGVGDALDDIKV